MLLTGGPRPANVVLLLAERRGISTASLRRAKVRCGIVSTKVAAEWRWSLGNEDAQKGSAA
jgi:hypothetical protein